MTLSPRERFLYQLATQPPRPADAIVVLAGEDAMPRLEMGLRAFYEGGAPVIVVSGGKSDPPHLLSAEQLKNVLVGKGIAPDRIVVEADSQNTREQATEVVFMASRRGWKRLILVASSYHAPRVFLSFLNALQSRFSNLEGQSEEDFSLDRQIRLIPMSSNQSPWEKAPEGVSVTRGELLEIEAQKIDEYHALGHVASYSEGVEYLKFWEGK